VAGLALVVVVTPTFSRQPDHRYSFHPIKSIPHSSDPILRYSGSKRASPLVMRTWSSAMWRKAANVRREWQKAWALRHKMTLKRSSGQPMAEDVPAQNALTIPLM
jgi:hypothetical protein